MTDAELAGILVKAHDAIHRESMSDLLFQLARLDRYKVSDHTHSEIPTLYASSIGPIGEAPGGN